MGYRSHVIFAVKEDIFIKKLAKIEDPSTKENLNSMICNCNDWAQDDGWVLYEWNSIKWYSTYNDVGWIENLMLELDNKHYSFVRLGEEGEYKIEEVNEDCPFEFELIRELRWR